MTDAHTRWLAGISLVAASLGLVCDAEADELSLTRVRLYETGIAYYERSGVVPKDRRVELRLPAGHLDDVLKTLVVLARGDSAPIRAVTFDSAISRQRASAMAGFRGSDRDALEFVTLLGALRGKSVEVRTANERVLGRVVAATPRTEPSAELCAGDKTERGECTAPKSPSLTLMTESGALRRFSIDQISSARPTDMADQRALGSALDALGGQRGRGERTLELDADIGTPIALGYVGEAPVWRPSYRLVLDAGGEHSTLRGWALIHNDSNEDWRRVSVQLVNGEPDSFLLPLAAPRYATRRLVTPERSLSTVGQLMNRTVDDMWLPDHFSDESGESFGGALGLSGIGEGGGGRAVGIGSIGSEETSLLDVGNLAALAEARGREQGALFEYTIGTPLDLSAQSSALVPFVDQRVGVERWATFDVPGRRGQSTLRLANDTPHTLPAGPIAIFGAGGLLGESAIDRLKPGGRALVHFGVELDLELDLSGTESSDEVRALDFDAGKLVEHYVRRTVLNYQLENRAGEERRVLVKLDLVNNARVEGASGIHHDAARAAFYAELAAAARSSERHVLTAHEGLQRRIDLEDISLQRLDRLAASHSLSESTRVVVHRARKLLDRAYEHRFRVARLRAGIGDLAAESGRLAETIHSVSSARGPRLDALMDRLERLERRMSTTRHLLAQLEKQEPWAAVRQELGKLGAR